LNPVKPNQSPLRGHPKVTVRTLRDARDAVVRQPIIGLPRPRKPFRISDISAARCDESESKNHNERRAKTKKVRARDVHKKILTGPHGRNNRKAMEEPHK
jgi:hypothetical protein